MSFLPQQTEEDRSCSCRALGCEERTLCWLYRRFLGFLELFFAYLFWVLRFSNGSYAASADAKKQGECDLSWEKQYDSMTGCAQSLEGRETRQPLAGWNDFSNFSCSRWGNSWSRVQSGLFKETCTLQIDALLCFAYVPKFLSSSTILQSCKGKPGVIHPDVTVGTLTLLLDCHGLPRKSLGRKDTELAKTFAKMQKQAKRGLWLDSSVCSVSCSETVSSLQVWLCIMLCGACVPGSGEAERCQLQFSASWLHSWNSSTTISCVETPPGICLQQCVSPFFIYAFSIPTAVNSWAMTKTLVDPMYILGIWGFTKSQSTKQIQPVQRDNSLSIAALSTPQAGQQLEQTAPWGADGRQGRLQWSAVAWPYPGKSLVSYSWCTRIVLELY